MFQLPTEFMVDLERLARHHFVDGEERFRVEDGYGNIGHKGNRLSEAGSFLQNQ